MREKIEIKVYLPIKMVGELESRNKLRVRSKFIQSAIRAKLDDGETWSIRDIPTKQLLHCLLHRDISSYAKNIIETELSE